MNKTKKLIALALVMILLVSSFAGCRKKKADTTTAAPAATEAPAAAETKEPEAAAKPEEKTEAAEPAAEKKDDTPLVVGYSNFNAKFSPFFSETAYDQDVWYMTQTLLLNTDRQGAVVYKGIEGETVSYNGTDYTYYGPANMVVTENEDGSVDFDFTLREGMTFSDGEKVTIDDVIFSMYVLSDPTYDGSSTFYALPIEGMAEYRSGMDTLFNLLVAAGPNNTDFTYWTEEQQTAFWADLQQAGEKFLLDIKDYLVAAGANKEDDPVNVWAANWGFSVPEGGTLYDLGKVMVEAYGWDLASLSSTENAGTSLFDHMENYSAYTVGVETGESAASIKGITKTGDYSMNIHMTKVDATSIYTLGFAIAPMHYYGDPAQYDYDNNSFGFVKGDLSKVRSVTTQPMGAGPYKFLKYENGVVYFEANESYYLGAPKTRYINFIEGSDQDKINGVLTGTIDITDPTFSTENIKAIETANGGELNGAKIMTSTVDNLGYGYIGISADAVNVGGVANKSSDESKALRKAFGTIFAVYRDVAVDSYYGERASVINYPISNTSWAAPQATDEGYKVAFSVDVDGNDIYTSSMTAEEKYEAAKKAALGFFEAAGYTVEDGKLTAAPEGAALSYTAWIPGDGTGDHPSFMLLTEARDALASIGMELIVKDLSNSSDLWDGLDAGQVPIWCAAWGATPDPDMYQIYYSDVANGGKEAGGSNYMYDIADEELDQLILDARSSFDTAYRKAMYKACLDIIVSWAVEIPVYQRQNAVIFSAERVNLDSVTPDITTFYGWLNEVQNIELQG